MRGSGSYGGCPVFGVTLKFDVSLFSEGGGLRGSGSYGGCLVFGVTLTCDVFCSRIVSVCFRGKMFPPAARLPAEKKEPHTGEFHKAGFCIFSARFSPWIHRLRNSQQNLAISEIAKDVTESRIKLLYTTASPEEAMGLMTARVRELHRAHEPLHRFLGNNTNDNANDHTI